MNFLFWNLNRRPLKDQLAAAVAELAVDVLILAENPVPSVELLTHLNRSLRPKFAYPRIPIDRLTILARLPRRSLVPVLDSPGIAIRRLRAPLGPEILLVSVHLASKMYHSDADQALFATRLMLMVEDAETQVGHTRTVIVGDLNMNPFESGVVGAGGFHAVGSRSVAARGSRVVQGEARQFFYNPMWSHFGDRPPSPPGTYYYSRATQVSYFWNMFDQVLIRPSLLDYFADEDLSIVTHVGGLSLLDGRGLPDTEIGSDHLPLFFRLHTAEDRL
ncbi:MAG: hypothetical protein M3081_02880 [Gemmatimonadota bacterium]|nr:hypothetical protein [Gemmatimonadota bacterium]